MWRDTHTLYPYQERASKIMQETNILLAYDMGTGKSPTTIHALESLRGRDFNGCGTVVVPASLKWQWANEVAKFTDQSALVIDGSAKQRREQYLSISRGGYGYMVMSYDTFVRDFEHHNPHARGFLVLDECFPAGTPVDTPNGSVPIEDVRVGDTVYSAYGRSLVRRTMTKKSFSLVRVVLENGTSIVCTPNHPFFTSVGWRPASVLRHGDTLVGTDEAVRLVRYGDAHAPEVQERSQTDWAVLREELLGEMEDDPAIGAGARLLRRLTGEAVGEEQGLARIAVSGGALGEVQSSQERMDGRIGAGRSADLEGEREYSPGPSRQRESSDRRRATAAGQVGTGLGVEPGGFPWSEEGRLSDPLQVGSGTAGTFARSGGGWQLPQVAFQDGAGSQKGRNAVLARVDRVEVLEPGHPDFDRLSGGSGAVDVYNLEVCGHPSYSVSGLLVHNCTAIKNFRSRRAQAVKSARSLYPIRFALTGTPIENGKAEEVFSIMEFVDPKVLGKYWAFEKRYIKRNPMGWIEGYHNLKEFHQKLAPYVARATHKQPEVAKYLPKVLHRDPIKVPLPASTGKAYRWIADDLLADLDALAASIHERAAQYRFIVDDDNENHPDGKLMAKITALRMLLDHPWSLVGSASRGAEYASRLLEDGIITGNEPPPKNEQFFEYVKDHLDADPSNKVVVFTSFVDAAESIAASYSNSALFHGGLTPRQREAQKQRFASDPSCRVFVSTDAGGYGLDLPQANLLINYDVPWQAGLLKQRAARIRRASSDWGYVVVQDFVVEGTIEERMWDLVYYKIAISDAIVDGEGITDAGTVMADLESLRTFLAKGD